MSNLLQRIMKLEERLIPRPARPDPRIRQRLAERFRMMAMAEPDDGPVRLTPQQAELVRATEMYRKLFDGVELVEDPSYTGSIALAAARVMMSDR